MFPTASEAVKAAYARVGEIMKENALKGHAPDVVSMSVEAYMSTLSPEVRAEMETYNDEMEKQLANLHNEADFLRFLEAAFESNSPMGHMLENFSFATPSNILSIAEAVQAQTEGDDYPVFRENLLARLNGIGVNDETLRNSAGSPGGDMLSVIFRPDVDDVSWIMGQLRDIARGVSNDNAEGVENALKPLRGEENDDLSFFPPPHR